MDRLPTVAVLGASGLVGEALASGLDEAGFPILAIARRFTPAQTARFGNAALVCPVAELDRAALTTLFADHHVDVVVNTLGVLQDSGRDSSVAVHLDFVARLVEALAGRPTLLVHVSIPGRDDDDRTAFARTKRAAEKIIAAADVSHAILRPGFVVAAAAYGGSALMRALAMLPVTLPADLSARPFATTDVDDIRRTVALVARRHAGGETMRVLWDVMERDAGTVGAAIEQFRHRFGGPKPRFALPAWSMNLGARAGDLVARLGWKPPIRSTALAEMWRGVAGDPEPWIAETGIEPRRLEQTLARLRVGVQERWFARLYFAKALVIATLAAFWLVSGGLALTISFAPARAILVAHGLPAGLATALTVTTALADIAVGLAIAHRKRCRSGLLGGIALSIGYLAAATILAPDLWLDPLGSLVKTIPATVLMMTAIALLDDR